MYFDRALGGYLFGFAVLLFITSILCYKTFVEKKGKKYLLIPFFSILVFYILFLGLLGYFFCNGPRSSEGCMGIGYLLYAIPFIIGVPLALVLINWGLFRIFKVTDKKRLKLLWSIFGIVCFLSLIVFLFAPWLNLMF